MTRALGLLVAASLLAGCDAPSTAPGAVPSASATSSAAASASVHAAKPSGAQPPAPEAVDATRDAARRIAGEILVGGRAMATLTELTDSVGPRLTGSEAHRRAAAWAVARFQSYGVDATTESFALERGWSRGEARGRVVGPREIPLHVASLGWTPGTPPGGLRGEIVKLDDVSAEGIARRKDDVKGKIAYVERAALRKARGSHPVARLAEAGALASLIHSGRLANVLGTTACGGLKNAPCAGPSFVVGLEDGATIERMLEKGPVTVEVASTSSYGPAVDVPNVVAEIRGREAADEVVLLGAHLDSWDFATGAQDNGSGAAQVLEAARAIRALGTPPRRTLRFALWAGEEQGLFGSKAYAAAHAAELDRLVAYLNTDHGAGAPQGWNVDAREDAAKALKPITKALLSGLSATAIETPIECDTDHCPFWTRGIPTLNLAVDDSKYDEIHHLGSDTIDKVRDGALSAGAAVLAITAYAIAELPERFAPRADHAALAKALKGSDLVPELVDEGLWKP